MKPGTCQYYNGIHRPSWAPDHAAPQCKAGVVYKEHFPQRNEPCIQYMVRSADGFSTIGAPGEQMHRWPSNMRLSPANTCSRRCEPTDEQVLEYQKDAKRHMDNFVLGLQVANAWRARNKPKTAHQEVVECPACKGRLHLSQNAYNGHVHGKCETAGCLSWME